MAEQQEQDRSEPASPFKLREARNRGQVSKSLEVNSFVVLSIGLALLYFLGEIFIENVLQFNSRLFSNSYQFSATPAVSLAWFEHSVAFLVDTFWPLMGALMVGAVLSNALQTGPVFSFFPLKPDVNRLNPVEGFKRLFSRKLIFESVKSIVKLGIFGFVIYLTMVAMISSLLALNDTSPDWYPVFLLDSVRGFMYKLLIVVFLVALIDLAYSKWDFSNRMRMSRRELKEEVKRREGDPQIRAKRRELQKEAVKRAGTMKKVPDADVLITNPVRLAVALKYDREQMDVPQLIAKGAGELARVMREAAGKHNIVIVENKPLARKLFKQVGVDQPIPAELFPVVARILAWVFVMREQTNPARGA